MLLPYKVAVVMRADSALGRTLAHRLVDEGARVVLSAATAAHLEPVLESVQVRGGTAMGIVGDPADASFARRLMDDTATKWGRVDALFNVVLSPRSRPFATLGNDGLDASLAGVRTAFVASRMALSASHGSLSIVHLLALDDGAPDAATAPGAAAYFVARGALRGLTEAMHADSQAAGIRTNAVLLNHGSLTEPTMVRAAETAAWLASDRAAHVSGVVLDL